MQELAMSKVLNENMSITPSSIGCENWIFLILCNFLFNQACVGRSAEAHEFNAK